MKIEVFGKGCKNCERLEDNVKIASEKAGIQVSITKVKDIQEIADRGVFKTPGLAINGEVVSTGRVLSPNKIEELLKEKTK